MRCGHLTLAAASIALSALEAARNDDPARLQEAGVGVVERAMRNEFPDTLSAFAPGFQNLLPRC